MSFLGLEGLHVFITGAAGGIGSQAVREFLDMPFLDSVPTKSILFCFKDEVRGGHCGHFPNPVLLGTFLTRIFKFFLAGGVIVKKKVAISHDSITAVLSPKPINNQEPSKNLFTVTGDISVEESIERSIAQAKAHFGPINILIANAGITDESRSYPIWDLPLELWEKTYNTNIRGTFLTVKHFLRSAEETQKSAGGNEIENLSIVVTGSECGKFGQAGHTDYASGKAALQYGLVRGVKNEIVRLNSKARINAVAPGWVDTPLIDGRLVDPTEMWTEAQATVPLRKIAQPEDVARAMAFLASHRAAGHISGECLSVDGGMEGRVVWKAEEVLQTSLVTMSLKEKVESILPVSSIPQALAAPTKRKIQVLLSVDFDAVSGFLGTGASPTNNMADFSSGFFAGQVGVPRLLKLFKKHGISSDVTWFIPGHSMETFPEQTKKILESGAEIGCHGYAHEGSSQLSEEQEREVIEKCVHLATSLTGRRPRGWRAPLYQLREHTVKVLQEQGFLYDTSLTHHDSQPYFLPQAPPIQPIDFSPHLSASTWMKPLQAPSPPNSETLVELPCNWYMEDMTPMQFLPSAPNSHGYVPASSIMEMWKSRFDYLYSEYDEEERKAGEGGDFVFPLVLHPDTSGMAHVIGMIDSMIAWLKSRGKEVHFCRFEDVAREWRDSQDI
ncbi:related to polysaccharide deacetylase family protein [Rhynchosporium graminicola]|uniref:Related to polysaccharide deacetylase family protein n=1 Tax=Rhynchosporium graminicola TaxID=2792576 RepID=A0A1E1KEB6_9HELO|nr:related to polysaccharide deacetylase family protein [Rhynchosporium commune]